MPNSMKGNTTVTVGEVLAGGSKFVRKEIFSVTRVRRLMVIKARPCTKLRTVTCCNNQQAQHIPVVTGLTRHQTFVLVAELQPDIIKAKYSNINLFL